MDLSKVIRRNILALAPYSCARDEFKGEASVYVDANESPYENGVNRYPDPLQHDVKVLLAARKGVREEQIFLGNGSDEAIDLIYRIFCEPRIDNVVAISPSYGMYQVCADVNDVEYRAVSLTEDFQLDIPAIVSKVDEHTKVIWICSPNNPSGNAFELKDLESIVQRYSNLVVVIDEAYIDFSDKGTMLSILEKYDNLIVLQTFSKAWGQAAIRCGIAYANPEIIRYFNRVKYPYNINVLTQQAAIRALSHPEVHDRHVEEILGGREILRILLGSLPIVEHIYPSDANFLLVRMKLDGMDNGQSADYIYHYLQNKGIIVRNRTRVHLCQGCLRITVGTPDENATLYETLKTI
ncbi:MAG: histidinol-phosphate transaminase [Bacteroidales bacterium]|nr:histidinol-phosphate transaminase [Bacteroidales bacterium]